MARKLIERCILWKCYFLDVNSGDFVFLFGGGGRVVVLFVRLFYLGFYNFSFRKKVFKNVTWKKFIFG